jgi:hypothetical protein
MRSVRARHLCLRLGRGSAFASPLVRACVFYVGCFVVLFVCVGAKGHDAVASAAQPLPVFPLQAGAAVKVAQILGNLSVSLGTLFRSLFVCAGAKVNAAAIEKGDEETLEESLGKIMDGVSLPHELPPGSLVYAGDVVEVSVVLFVCVGAKGHDAVASAAQPLPVFPLQAGAAVKVAQILGNLSVSLGTCFVHCLCAQVQR